jgi:hypothetical protein
MKRILSTLISGETKTKSAMTINKALSSKYPLYLRINGTKKDKLNMIVTSAIHLTGSPRLK